MAPFDLSEDDVFQAIGTLGGLILASALLPQIYLAHKSQSTKDISYLWQGVYTTGLLTIMVYYAYFKLWAVFFPVSFECACIMYLTALKVYYEGLPFKATEEEKVALGAPEGAKRADASYYTSIT